MLLLYLTRSISASLRPEGIFGFSTFGLHGQLCCERCNVQKGENDMEICPCESHLQDAKCFQFHCVCFEV